jgi:hypothetical protein
MRTYKNWTPGGLYFHLCLSEQGVCCIVVYDFFDCQAQIRYFTDRNQALRYINNL